MDLSKLSNADLAALQSGDMSKLSNEGLKALAGQKEAPKVPEQPTFGQMFQNELKGSPLNPMNWIGGGVRGAGDIGATLIRPFESGEENQRRRQAMTGALESLGADPKSLTFGVNRVGANIAGTSGVGGLLGGVAAKLGAPNALVQALSSSGMNAGGATGLPGMAARVAGGAATGGASAGLIDPTSAGAGAGIGAAIPAVGKLAGLAGGALGNMLTAGKDAPLARTAIDKYNIPLGIADVSPSKTTKALRSILNDAPLTGSIGAAQKEAVQEGFNKAVGGTFGSPDPKLTAQVMDTAKKRLGAEFDRIWNNNTLQVDPQLMTKMTDLQAVAKKLPKNEGASLSAEIDDLFNKMVPDPNGNAVIPGDVANKFQSYLRRRAEGSAGLKNELGDLRGEILAAFNRSVAPADAAALTQNRTMYKAFKTVEPLLNKAEAGVAGRSAGDIPPSLLPGAVVSSYANPAGAPLAELSQIGSKFMVDRTPQTGGSMRAALQNVGIGGGLMGLAATGNLAPAAAAIPAAAAVQYGLGNPALARMATAQPNAALVNALRQAMPVTYQAAPLLAAN